MLGDSVGNVTQLTMDWNQAKPVAAPIDGEESTTISYTCEYHFVELCSNNLFLFFGDPDRKSEVLFSSYMCLITFFFFLKLL